MKKKKSPHKPETSAQRFCPLRTTGFCRVTEHVSFYPYGICTRKLFQFLERMEQNKHMPNRRDELSTEDMHFEAVCSVFIKLLAYFELWTEKPRAGMYKAPNTESNVVFLP